MKPRVIIAAALMLSACATIVDEKRTTAVLDRGFNAGERYVIRTRTMQGPNGTYEQTSVVYRGVARTCIADSPGDCRKAAERLIEDYYESFF